MEPEQLQKTGQVPAAPACGFGIFSVFMKDPMFNPTGPKNDVSEQPNFSSSSVLVALFLFFVQLHVGLFL